MADRTVTAIWWRVLKPGEFFNIERRPDLVPGGGGARYIEIPKSLVADTIRFFEQDGLTVDENGFTINAVPIKSGVKDTSLITFAPKTGSRLRIANQNRQAMPNRRHPAWRVEAGFPVAPDTVESTEEASKFLPDGGIRIFIAKLNDTTYLAGFTAGFHPADLPVTSALQKLWVESGVGGVLWNLDLPVIEYAELT